MLDQWTAFQIPTLPTMQLIRLDAGFILFSPQCTLPSSGRQVNQHFTLKMAQKLSWKTFLNDLSMPNVAFKVFLFVFVPEC